MRHPTTDRLLGHIDQVLPPRHSADIRAHLETCADCRARVVQLQQLGAAVRQLAPAPAAFSSEGAFWARLAGRLQTNRRPAWSAISLLPPLVFVVLGATLDALLGAASFTWLLERWGALRPIAPRLLTRLQMQAPATAAELTPDWLGINSERVVTQVLNTWARLSPEIQDALLFTVTTLLLGTALTLLVVLSALWMSTWIRHERKERSLSPWNTGGS